MNNYSILMPLWQGENPEILKSSLKSMRYQTIPPSEIVFVVDALLPERLQLIINEVFGSTGIEIKIVELPAGSSSGLGSLLNWGVRECIYPFIARMDSDDISFLNRCEKELTIMEAQIDCAVVGSSLVEFKNTVKDGKYQRRIPEKPKQISAFAKYRNPMNHPTVMMRKKDILLAGNYDSTYLHCEDYELWYRLLKQGKKFYNIREPLLYFRTGDDFLNRRGRKENLQAYVKLKKQMLDDGFISWWIYLLTCGGQYIYYFSNIKLKRFIYWFLRRK